MDTVNNRDLEFYERTIGNVDVEFASNGDPGELKFLFIPDGAHLFKLKRLYLLDEVNSLIEQYRNELEEITTEAEMIAFLEKYNMSFIRKF